MLNRITFVALGCLLLLSGCMNEEPMPEIVYDSGYKSSVEPLKQRKLLAPAPAKQRAVSNNEGTSQQWQPPSSVEKKWTAIVIHHSATKNGDAAIFDKWHRENNGWEGVGYDFVIGNGSNSSNGQVEVTYRWQKQVTGAHCKTPGNWANKDGIGICLVGDFDKTQPTNAQMQSLVKLVQFLQKRYGIPKSKIYGHGTTPGAETKTDCPGRNFPMSWLKAQL